VFLSFFSSKNQKLVKQWTKEHKEILELTTKVSDAYKNNKYYTAKKTLKELRKITHRHLMTEDNELYKLTQSSGESNIEIESFVNEFNESFQDTKAALIHLLKEYTTDKAVLDGKFFKSFNILVLRLRKRFVYEEENLYKSLVDS